MAQIKVSEGLKSWYGQLWADYLVRNKELIFKIETKLRSNRNLIFFKLLKIKTATSFREYKRALESNKAYS